MAAFTGTFTYANSGLGLPRFVRYGNDVNAVSAPLAAATTVNPLSYINIVTGTAQIQSIVPPWPGFEGEITLIFTDVSPGATLTGGTAGAAIQLATTVVRYKALNMTYSSLTGLWYPSY